MQNNSSQETLRIGLIIQGPLISFGKPGAVAHISQDKISRTELVDYDCRSNISKLIKDFGHLFDSIVVSTWDDQLREGDRWEGVNIVTSPDPGGLAKRSPGLYKFNNKFRQFIGIQQGLEALKQGGGVDCVVRMRTDQYLDLELLVGSFLQQRESNKLYVPLFRPAGSLVADFYFAADSETLERFCDAVLADDMYEFISCVHREMVLKYAYYCFRNEIGVPDWAYFPRWPMHSMCRETKRIFSYMFDTAFLPLDPAVFRSLVWRGSRPTEAYLSSRLRRVDLEATSKLRLFQRLKYNHVLPAWLAIDWANYFAFRECTSGSQVSIAEKLLVTGSTTIWRIWIGGRRLLGAVRHLV